MRKGRTFEKDNAWLYELDQDKYKVTTPAYLYDKTADEKREVDVLIEYIDKNQIQRKIGIECRDRKHKQDVMWIEQLQQKREDLELDYIIATVTSDFTEGAIKKARYHGIILEKAEVLCSELLDEIKNEFNIDIYFAKYILHSISVLNNKGEILNVKKCFADLNVFSQEELKKELNMIILENCPPFQLLEDGKLTKEQFFDNTDNKMQVRGHVNITPSDERRGILDDLQIRSLKYDISILPFRISLPLNQSISVFDGDGGKNKKYRAFFGATDGDYVDTGYIEHNTKFKMNLRRRQFGFVGMDMHLNTILPEDLEMPEIDWKMIWQYIPECDFSRLFGRRDM